jgi:hypothetical protein
MNVTFRCPRCGCCVRRSIGGDSLGCPKCGAEIRLSAESIEDGRIKRCLVCGTTDLYVRKDFPQNWGLAIIGIGFLLSSVAWAYHNSVLSLGILLVSAAADAVLYMVMGDVVTCYWCHAEYRQLDNARGHPQFDLAVHERYRQQAERMRRVTQESVDSVSQPHARSN